MRMQFDAQHAHNQEHYAGAAFDVILVFGQPAGGSTSRVKSDEIRIVDLALLREALQPRHRDDAAARTAVRGGGRRHAAAHPRRTLQSRAPALRASRIPFDRRSRGLSVHGMAGDAAFPAKAGSHEAVRVWSAGSAPRTELSFVASGFSRKAGAG